MASNKKQNSAVKKTILAVALTFTVFVCLAGLAAAQGSRKDDLVFGPSGHPIAGATITVCQPTATGIPCTPLATIYTDATLTVAAPNPTAAAATGGSLAAGTYYATVTSTSDNCTHQSALSIQSTGVALSGSNNAVTVDWRPPVAEITPLAARRVPGAAKSSLDCRRANSKHQNRHRRRMQIPESVHLWALLLAGTDSK
jgi:hypothetical protein